VTTRSFSFFRGRVLPFSLVFGEALTVILSFFAIFFLDLVLGRDEQVDALSVLTESGDVAGRTCDTSLIALLALSLVVSKGLLLAVLARIGESAADCSSQNRRSPSRAAALARLLARDFGLDAAAAATADEADIPCSDDLVDAKLGAVEAGLDVSFGVYAGFGGVRSQAILLRGRPSPPVAEASTEFDLTTLPLIW
jgi:hypothetical protein